jgi:hypothetical protein
VGKPIKVTVTGKAAGYTSKSLSATVLWPYAATGTLAVVGDAVVGQSLGVDVGAWSPSPSFKYQWLREGKAISKATKASYKLVAADRDKNITVKVTIAKAGYEAQPVQTLGPVGPIS